MQNSLFDFPQLEINKKIRLITLFSGIGSQEMALRDIGADFEIHFVCEFDKYAMRSYNAIHGTSFETSDIRDIHGADLKITEREILLSHDLFISMCRLISCRKNARYV